ncbi:probable E3 ubiquitin-protein ligase MARCH10 [Alligator sinensis]|uniref:RING-type E3 ubiquitin transferase n=1 Tax=Alligator sinensis TaxID=38654 RepID=A0A3Q0FYR7_ALLSI|nr:probable E3 ubiquitin-protein ligase MARCH10 [Alligator sinensis]
MYKERERQKLTSDAQYAREIQHKMDSEHQACLRRQEQNREQAEKRRDQHTRPEQREKTLSFLSSTRSYERPWISAVPVTRQTSADEGSGCEQKSAIKSLGNKHESKFPDINKPSVKQKQKSTTSSKKVEKNLLCPNKITPASQKQSFSRGKRENQRGSLGSSDIQNIRKLEDRDKMTSLLQAKTKVTRRFDFGVQKDGKEQTSENTFKYKKKSQERRNLIQSSKLNLDQKGPDRDKNMENVFIQAQQSSAQSSAPTFQGTSGSFLSHQSNGPSPTSTQKAPLKFRDENIYSMLCFNMEDTYEDNDSRKEEEELLEEEFTSFSLNQSHTPLEQASFPHRTSLVQDKQFNSEEVRDDKNVLSRRTESSHQPLRKLSITDSAVEQFSPGQRKSRDSGKSCAPYQCFFEDMASDKNENETLSLSSRNSQTENKLDGTSISENLNNASADVYNRERQSYESNQRCYADLLTSARATSHQPLFYSAYSTPRSLIRSLHGAEASANLSSTTVPPQVLDLDGTSRFNVHRPLSPIRSRGSFSAVESYDPLPILNPPEESTSPSAPSHDEENLLNSQSSFISLDSTNPILFQSDFTAYLYMAGIQHDQLSLALLAMSDLHNQNNAMSNITPSHSPFHSKEIKKPSTDPEKLKRLKDSLLEEDSEEEGDQCRICQIAGGSITNPLLEPCSCVGSLQYVHQECLKSWLKAKIKSGADLETVKNCELCKQSLVVELGDFNVSDYYRNHQQSQAHSELMNAGVYLVLLLHLYEQRFAELMNS